VTYFFCIHTLTSSKTSCTDLIASSKPGASTKTTVLPRITIEVWRINWSSDLRVWFAQLVVCVKESTNYLEFRRLKERFEGIHTWLFPLPWGPNKLPLLVRKLVEARALTIQNDFAALIPHDYWAWEICGSKNQLLSQSPLHVFLDLWVIFLAAIGESISGRECRSVDECVTIWIDSSDSEMLLCTFVLVFTSFEFLTSHWLHPYARLPFRSWESVFVKSWAHHSKTPVFRYICGLLCEHWLLRSRVKVSLLA